MSASARAAQALERLAPEDVPLVLRELLDPIPLEAWPGLLLNGRTLDEIEGLVLHVVLSFLTSLEHAEVITLSWLKVKQRGYREDARGWGLNKVRTTKL